MVTTSDFHHHRGWGRAAWVIGGCEQRRRGRPAVDNRGRECRRGGVPLGGGFWARGGGGGGLGGGSSPGEGSPVRPGNVRAGRWTGSGQVRAASRRPGAPGRSWPVPRC